MDELERQFNVLMDQIEPPLTVDSPLRKTWITVARNASDKINQRLKQEISKRPKRPSTGAGLPELVQWFRSLPPNSQKNILGNWSPAKAHFIQKPHQINIDMRDDSHIDDNDYFGNIVTESVSDAMNEDTSWVGPLLQNLLKAK